MTSKVRYCTYSTAGLFHCVSALANGWRILYVGCVWEGEGILCTKEVRRVHVCVEEGSGWCLCVGCVWCVVLHCPCPRIILYLHPLCRLMVLAMGAM